MYCISVMMMIPFVQMIVFIKFMRNVALVLHLSAATTAQGKLTSISDSNHLFNEVAIQTL